MSSIWDERYRETEGVYGREANPFWMSELVKCEGDNLLLPCEGEGRNAVWGAQQGWNVHAFDSSGVGLETMKRWSQEAGVYVNAEHADAFEFMGRPGGYDVVGLFYAHMPAHLRQAFHALAIKWLAPGGTLILEAFHVDQLNLHSGGPKDIEMLFTESLVRSDFKELSIQQCERVETSLNEGPFHQGPAVLLRMVGTKSKRGHSIQ